jgi:protein-S-isoprenylcysteine O-methyltransferase Ste14
MENGPRDRANVVLPPPVIFVVCMALALFMENMISVPFIGLSGPLRVSLGVLLIILSGLLAINALTVLRGYLSGKFGKEYYEYKARTRRWI